MKKHPDRYSDPEEKKKATVQFQKISAAYSVLRDRKLFQFLCLYIQREVNFFISFIL